MQLFRNKIYFNATVKAGVSGAVLLGGEYFFPIVCRLSEKILEVEIDRF